MIEPLVDMEVALTVQRVCHGFRQAATLIVFDSLAPCCCVCFRLRDGKHYHLLSKVETEDDLVQTMLAAALNPERAVESLLSDLFDPMTEAQRKQLEVTPERKYG